MKMAGNVLRSLEDIHVFVELDGDVTIVVAKVTILITISRAASNNQAVRQKLLGLLTPKVLEISSRFQLMWWRK